MGTIKIETENILLDIDVSCMELVECVEMFAALVYGIEQQKKCCVIREKRTTEKQNIKLKKLG